MRAGAFPGWATIPAGYDLAGARRWHLTFAWAFGPALLAYLVHGVASGHLRRNLLSDREPLGRRGTRCRYGDP